METAPRPEEIARISAALISALAEAQQMAHAGKIDADFASLTQHVRDMYELLDETLQAAGDAVPAKARAVAERLGAAIEHMEQVLLHDGSTH